MCTDFLRAHKFKNKTIKLISIVIMFAKNKLRRVKHKEQTFSYLLTRKIDNSKSIMG